jgi:hypothetical protein
VAATTDPVAERYIGAIDMQTVSAHRPSVNTDSNCRCFWACWWRETRKLALLAFVVTVALW